MPIINVELMHVNSSANTHSPCRLHSAITKEVPKKRNAQVFLENRFTGVMSVTSSRDVAVHVEVLVAVVAGAVADGGGADGRGIGLRRRRRVISRVHRTFIIILTFKSASISIILTFKSEQLESGIDGGSPQLICLHSGSDVKSQLKSNSCWRD